MLMIVSLGYRTQGQLGGLRNTGLFKGAQPSTINAVMCLCWLLAYLVKRGKAKVGCLYHQKTKLF